MPVSNAPGSSLSGGPAASRGPAGPEVVLPVDRLLHFLVLKETGSSLSDGSALMTLTKEITSTLSLNEDMLIVFTSRAFWIVVLKSARWGIKTLNTFHQAA